jgi:hypothetical protein
VTVRVVGHGVEANKVSNEQSVVRCSLRLTGLNVTKVKLVRVGELTIGLGVAFKEVDPCRGETGVGHRRD